MTTAIYNKLLQLIPDIDAKPEYRKSVVSGFMDLNFDLLAVKGNVLTIALSHYYKHSCGDMIADPDVVMTVDLDNHLVEPVSYQDAMIYQQVPNNKVLAEKAVEPVWVYYESEEKIDDRPFKILRDLIDILETNYDAMHIDKQAKKSMCKGSIKTVAPDDWPH